MRCQWPGTIDINRCGMALCWIAALCICPFFWTVFSLLLLYRCLAAALVGRKCVLLSGMDAIIGQEIHSPNCMINATLFLEGPGRVDAVANFERFYQQVVTAEEPEGSGRKLFPNFSRCLAFRYGFLAWRDVDMVDITHHLYEHPQVVSCEDDLQKVINVHFNRVLPAADHPPWELIMVHLDDKWRLPRFPAEVVPRAVWLWRIHHSIVDGISLLRIMSEVLATNREQLRGALVKRMGPPPRWQRPPEKIGGLFVVRRLVTIVLLGLRNLVERDRGFLLARPASHRKNFAWFSRPVTLERVRAIGRATADGIDGGFTVNDVLMSCVAGALRVFLGGEFDGAVPRRLRTYVPVSRQALDGPLRDGNQFVCPAVKLPTGIGDPKRRLVATKVETTKLKRVIGNGVHDLNTWMAGKAFSRSVMPVCLLPMTPSMTFSNMVGSPLPLELVGCRLAECCVFTPNSFITGVSVAIVSYCDSFTISVVMDTGINKEAEVAGHLARLVENELEQLERSLLLLDQTSKRESSKAEIKQRHFCDQDIRQIA